jgi:hypothetical protein
MTFNGVLCSTPQTQRPLIPDRSQSSRPEGRARDEHGQGSEANLLSRLPSLGAPCEGHHSSPATEHSR